MKIERVIQLAGLMERGNVLPEELAIAFLSEFDGMIQSDIMLHAPEEIVRYDSKDQELILRPPHDGLYLSFLVAMIRQCQGEFEGYNNAQEIVEDKLKTFRRWYIHHYRPADTNSRSYTGGTSGDGFGFAYLSAYGLAAKHGYQGTEEEWLQSLKGEKGDAGAAARMRYDAERDMVQWGVGDEWHDLYTMAEVLAPLYEKLDEMTARAETAAGEAAGHAQAAQTAREQVENVLHDAEGHAREALYQANNAKAAAQVAKQAGADAEAARREAARLRDETRILMQDTETAAQTARDEAERAAEAAAAGGVKTGKDAPSTETEGRVGSLYLQTGITPNCQWVCIGADDGVYRWQQCNAYAELDLRDGGDGGVLLVPEGTETQPVLNLYGRNADENVTLRGVAPAQRDTDAPNLRQVQELIGQGGSGGAGYVASDEPPENTKAMWVNTSEQGEAVALGVTAVETAEGAELYCTDELGTTKVTVLNGRDGAQGPAGPQGAPGDDYVLTDEDRQEIAGIAAGMVPGGVGVAVSRARVGQTIRVAAVDDSGKPTDWEAVEFPSIPFANAKAVLRIDAQIAPLEDGSYPQIYFTEDIDGNPLKMRAFCIITDWESGASYTRLHFAKVAENRFEYATSVPQKWDARRPIVFSTSAHGILRMDSLYSNGRDTPINIPGETNSCGTWAGVSEVTGLGLRYVKSITFFRVYELIDEEVS